MERAFDFIRLNSRERKPRKTGLTEIRGPYYSVMGKNYLKDVLDTMADYIDSLKYAGGSFALMPKQEVEALNHLAHDHAVEVSTGGFIEHILATDPPLVDRYVQECKQLGFDTIELSCGFITLSLDDWLRLVEKIKKAGLKAKPEVGIQFGAGGASEKSELEAEGTQDVDYALYKAERLLDAGASIIMMESEGVTENVDPWRTELPTKFISRLGLDKVMFEAADPPVFQWYIKNYGPDVNLFVDHSQIVQLETLRSGIWGTKSLWGRVVSFKEEKPNP